MAESNDILISHPDPLLDLVQKRHSADISHAWQYYAKHYPERLQPGESFQITFNFSETCDADDINAILTDITWITGVGVTDKNKETLTISGYMVSIEGKLLKGYEEATLDCLRTYIESFINCAANTSLDSIKVQKESEATPYEAFRTEEPQAEANPTQISLFIAQQVADLKKPKMNE